MPTPSRIRTGGGNGRQPFGFRRGSVDPRSISCDVTPMSVHTCRTPWKQGTVPETWSVFLIPERLRFVRISGRPANSFSAPWVCGPLCRKACWISRRRTYVRASVTPFNASWVPKSRWMSVLVPGPRCCTAVQRVGTRTTWLVSNTTAAEGRLGARRPRRGSGLGRGMNEASWVRPRLDGLRLHQGTAVHRPS